VASVHGGFGGAKKESIGRAARTGPQTFMRQQQRDIPLTGAHCRFGKCPVDDAALGVAAADLP
jgi:hypothetical protein